MLIKLAEQQAEKMQEEAVKHLGSDEMTEKIATAINKRIDIPFVSEDKEQIFFEKVVDVVTDILEGVFKGKYNETDQYYTIDCYHAWIAIPGRTSANRFSDSSNGRREEEKEERKEDLW